MTDLDDLLAQISDDGLRSQLQSGIELLTRQMRFGLVFERHIPESVRVYSAEPRIGDLVQMRAATSGEEFTVEKLTTRAARIESTATGEQQSVKPREIVVVKRFGDPIYPALHPEIYGTSISKDTISRITDAIVADMEAWQSRPLDPLYAVVLVDAIVIKVRDTQIANRPVYVAIGVNMDGERDKLGLWLGPSGGEGAKQWMTILTELRNRGVLDVLITCCDGLKGLPDAARTVWPDTTVQTCVVHLVRNSLRYASKKHWRPSPSSCAPCTRHRPLRRPRPSSTTSPPAGKERYPAMIQSWRNSWDEFVPFLEFPPELLKVVYTTNAVESLDARFRRAVHHRGHFPTEQAAMKVLYLVATRQRKNRQDLVGRMNGWKAILNTLTVHYGERVTQHL